MIVCCNPIPVKALLRRPPGTPTISPVVKNKDRKTLVEEEAHIIKAVRDIPCVSVKKQNEGGLSGKGEKPTMQLPAILRIEKNIFIVQMEVFRLLIQMSLREKYKKIFNLRIEKIKTHPKQKNQS
jgi:hypothetical protein